MVVSRWNPKSDTSAVAYVCLFDVWFRNYLVRFGDYLSKLEKR